MKRLLLFLILALLPDAKSATTLVGDLVVQKTVTLQGTITPAAITADQNDWAPASFVSAESLRISSDAARTVTGLAGGAAGRQVKLFNVGNFNLILANASGSSAAANQFALGADVTLTPGTGILLQYDGTSLLWRSAGAASSGGSGTVTSVSVVSANGLAGTVSNPTATPAITLSTTVSGILKGNGTAISAASSGTDYAPATSGSSILKGNGAGGFSAATSGTDYLAPSGSGAALTGVVYSVAGNSGTVTQDQVTGLASTGIIKRTAANTMAIASSGTDYAPATSGSSVLKGNGSGGFSNASAGTDYEVPLTFSTGLTRTVNTIAVNASQNISTLSNLTSNGFVKTSGGTGALTIDTSIYLTLTGSGSGLSGIPTSIIGTAGQVAASASTGAVTLSLPTSLTGINSITSAALSNLVLGTGTFGTALTFASATGAATFAGVASVQKSQAGLTTVGAARQVRLSDVNGAANNLTEIGFGYDASGANAYQPVVIGHKVTNTSGTTSGSFYIATRALQTDTAPIVRVTVASTGEVAVSSTTASTSTTTGAVVIGANIGLSGNAGGPSYFGGAAYFGGPGVTNAPTAASQSRFTATTFSGNYSAGFEVYSSYAAGTPSAGGLVFYPSAYTGTDAFGAAVSTHETILYHGATTGALKLGANGYLGLTLTGTASVGTVAVVYTTAASSSTVGALVVGNGTAATSVAVGGGNINLGGSLTVGGPSSDKVTTLTYASPTSVTVTSGNVFTVTTVNATGSVTFNASGTGTSGQHMELIIINDATSGKTITFGTNFKSSGTLTGIPSKTSTIRFTSDGTSWWETSRVTGTL